MKAATDMRAGMVIRLDEDLYRVLVADYHGGGGKMHGVMHAKLIKLSGTGSTERRFRQDERFEEVPLERQEMEFLFQEGDQCTFMHPETYDQVTLDVAQLGPYQPFLQPNQLLQIEFCEGKAVSVNYPASVELQVTSTPEPLRSDSNVSKEALLENGMEVLVPQFIKVGDIVRIDVENRKYQERMH